MMSTSKPACLLPLLAFAALLPLHMPPPQLPRNNETGVVQQEHPLDNYCRELIRRRRRELLRRKKAALKSLQVRKATSGVNNTVRSVATLCCGVGTLPGEPMEFVDCSIVFVP